MVGWTEEIEAEEREGDYHDYVDGDKKTFTLGCVALHSSL